MHKLIFISTKFSHQPLDLNIVGMLTNDRPLHRGLWLDEVISYLLLKISCVLVKKCHFTS